MRAAKLPSLRGDITNGLALRQSAAKAIGEVETRARRSKTTPPNGAALKTFFQACVDAVDAAVAMASAAVPANTVAPALSGTATVGQTLTVTNGTWTGSPTPTYSRAWLRDGVVIPGATGTTYVLVGADEDAVITVRVTATNTTGTASAVSNASAPVAAA